MKHAIRCKSNRLILHLHQLFQSELAYVPTLQITIATRLAIQNVARRMAVRIVKITLPFAITMPRAKAASTIVLTLQTISATTLLTASLVAALKMVGH